MADRRIKVILEAQAANFQRGMDRAKRATEQFRGETEKMSKQDAMKTLAPSFTAFGAAVTAGLGAATKASMDWESAWAGVQKTVDGTPEQMAELEDGLRSMAKELPATHEEIAGVAEAAGQLGVKTEDVESFTRTMIDMGESTNMTADEAATTLARFANIMGTSTDEMENLGSSIVDLGNNSATTESEIATMGQRLAGAGVQAGLTEGEVMGIAAAMSSVGIEAESGGTAMSRTMKRITNAVDEGSDKLDTFAQLAGMSAQEFKTAWEEDPAMALQAVVEGLGRAEQSGQNTNKILEELGVTSMREADALLRLSSASDLMGDSMERGNQAFEEATALSEEAAQRYETTASKISMAWNSIKDAAMQAGEVILPAVGGMADAVGDLADWFGELPQPAQESLTILGGFSGVAALAAGGFVTLAPRIVETKDALKTLTRTSPGTRAGLKNVGRAASGAVAAFAALQVASEIDDQLREGGRSAEEFSAQLDELADKGDDASLALEGMTPKLEESSGFWRDLGEQLGLVGPKVGPLTEGIDDLGSAMDTLNNTSMIPDWALFGPPATVREDISGLATAYEDMVADGNIEQATTQMSQMAASAQESGYSLNDLRETFPEYVAGLREFAKSNDIALESQELLKWAFEGTVPEAIKAKGGIDGVRESAKGMPDAAETADEGAVQLQEALDEVGVSADGVVESMDKFLEQLFQAGILQQSTREANAAYEASLDSVNEAIQTVADSNGEMGRMLNKNKTDFDLTTEAGRTAQSAFHDVASSGRDAATAMAENGASQDEIQQKLSGTSSDLIQAAQDFGLSEDAARELTREILGVPEDVSIESWMSEEAKRVADETAESADAIDGRRVEMTTVLTTVRRTITETANAGASGSAVGDFMSSAMKKASGGAVRGPGSGTSDDIPAMLSNGEHVLTAREVEAMGGQQGVYRFRSQLTSGPTSMTPATGADVRAFASGGAVAAAGPSAQDIASAIAETDLGGANFVQNNYHRTDDYGAAQDFKFAMRDASRKPRKAGV